MSGDWAHENMRADAQNQRPPDGKTKRICLVVLGMHRSGTSALTRVLSLLGAKLPATLNAPGGGNELGLWEPERLIQLDDRILEELGSSWRDWRPLDLSRVTRSRRAEFKLEIADIVAAEFGDAPMIVIKEPRLCRFAPLLFEALQTAGYDTRCILPTRSPLEVARSLEKRDAMPRAEATLLWLRHVLDAEIATRGTARTFLAYETLLDDWRNSTAAISERLRVSWAYTSDEVAPQVEAFLQPERRHHRSTTEELLHDPMLRDWAADVFQAVLVLERNPDSAAALSVLDRVRQEFNGASPIIERLLADASAKVEAAERHALETATTASSAAAAQTHALAAAHEEQARAVAAAQEEQVRAVAAAQEERARAVAAVQEEQAQAVAVAEEREARAVAEAEERARVFEISAQTSEATVALARETVARLQEENSALMALVSVYEEREQTTRRALEDLAQRLADAHAARLDLQRSVEQRALELEAARGEARRADDAVVKLVKELHGVRADAERDRQDLQTQLEVLRETVAQRDAQLHAMGSSTSWRITRPIRGAKRLFTDTDFRRALPSRVAGKLGLRRTPGAGLKRWSLPWAAHVARGLLNDERYRRNAFARIGHVMGGGALDDAHNAPEAAAVAETRQDLAHAGIAVEAVRSPYDAWLAVNALTETDRRELRTLLQRSSDRTPKISVIMPAYNSDERLLREAVESVRAQIYENWELCLVDDRSPKGHVWPLLLELARTDPRIKVSRRDANGGIAECTNSAVSIATGAFIAFVDHDDLITPDCLAEIALYCAARADADIVYSDDDKVDLDGRRFDPQFKPDASPAMLLSFMYMGHVFAVRRALFQELGGFRKGFDGSQDYDFALRAIERARHVGHVPKILYNWRTAPGSTATGGDAKPESFEAGRKAVQEALDRRGLAGKAIHPDWALRGKNGIFAIEFPDEGPSVTLIIPTKDKLDLLQPCVESLSKTTYKNFEIMVVDNDSAEPSTLAYLEQISARDGVRVERISNNGKPFSYSRLNNEAVRRATTEFVLLLNNDTEIINPRWLSQMMGYALMPGIGAVGAKLFYGDHTIQHAGILHGLYDGLVGCAFRNAPGHEWGYLNSLKVAREYSAVTAACMLVRKSLYESMGGLDEDKFNVAYNDVDFCYRLTDAGYRCVCAADAELFHHEGRTRGFKDDPREPAAFRETYRRRVDPWYNAHLSLEDEHFRIRGARLPRRSSAPVRAAMVSHNLQHEGAPNVMAEVVVGLKRRGVLDPIVLAPADGPLRAFYEENGVDVRVIPHPLLHVHEEGQFQTTMAAFAETLQSLRPDVVYGNTLQTFWAIAAAEKIGLPAIWNPRESEECASYFDYLSPPLRKHAYACFASAYSVVYCAHATRRHWAPLLTRSNFRVVHDGLQEDRLLARAAIWSRESARERLGLAADDVMVVLVGTVCDRKGQLDLIDAMSHLDADAAGRIRVFIVGDRPNPYSDRAHAAVAALPAALRERVTIVRETGDPYLYFKAADISVCTSRIESYPRVILEAMAFALPVVTTTVFGIVEQVREGTNALFYEQGRPAELAGQLSLLINDGALRRKMADNSPHVLRSLPQFDDMLDGFESVFREAANLAPPR